MLEQSQLPSTTLKENIKLIEQSRETRREINSIKQIVNDHKSSKAFKSTKFFKRLDAQLKKTSNGSLQATPFMQTKNDQLEQELIEAKLAHVRA